jgi:hypothetical protein
MAQSSTWCYQLEVGSDIRIDHNNAAKTLDSTKKTRPASREAAPGDKTSN